MGTNNKKDKHKKVVVVEVRTKTQRELNQLLEFIQKEREVTHGQVMIKFGWAYSKCYSMLRALTQAKLIVKERDEDGAIWKIS